jgi:hypothetical protein
MDSAGGVFQSSEDLFRVPRHSNEQRFPLLYFEHFRGNSR